MILAPDITLFQYFYRKVVKVDLQNPNTGLLQAIDQLTLKPLHFNGFFRFERANKKRHLVAKALLLEKTLAGDHSKKMLKSILHWHFGYICFHCAIPFRSDSKTGKYKISRRLP